MLICCVLQLVRRLWTKLCLVCFSHGVADHSKLQKLPTVTGKDTHTRKPNGTRKQPMQKQNLYNLNLREWMVQQKRVVVQDEGSLNSTGSWAFALASPSLLHIDWNVQRTLSNPAKPAHNSNCPRTAPRVSALTPDRHLMRQPLNGDNADCLSQQICRCRCNMKLSQTLIATAAHVARRAIPTPEEQVVQTEHGPQHVITKRLPTQPRLPSAHLAVRCVSEHERGVLWAAEHQLARQRQLCSLTNQQPFNKRPASQLKTTNRIKQPASQQRTT